MKHCFTQGRALLPNTFTVTHRVAYFSQKRANFKDLFSVAPCWSCGNGESLTKCSLAVRQCNNQSSLFTFVSLANTENLTNRLFEHFSDRWTSKAAEISILNFKK